MTSAHLFSARVLPPGSPTSDMEEFRVAGWTVRYPRGGARWAGKVARQVRRGASALRNVPIEELVALLGSVGVRFLDPTDPLRREALEALPAVAGVSPEMARAILDGMAADWTQDRLRAALEADVGSLKLLDHTARIARGRTRALGPELAFQVVSGSVPGVGATALLRSLLVKAPTLLKAGRGDVVLPVLMARELARLHPALEASLGVLYWPGGSADHEDAVLGEADTVVVYGGDATVRSLRDRTPVTTRFVAYHHRVSVGLVGREALDDRRAGATARSLARAVGLFDQRGCVSPQLVYVERGGARSAKAFAREVAQELEALEAELPGGRLDPTEAALLHQMRGTAELEEAAGTAWVHYAPEASWTVIQEEDPDLRSGGVGRVLRMKSVDDLAEVPELLRPLGRHLQTVGLAGGGQRTDALIEALARVGVSRVATFDRMPFPPSSWHHDGRGPLSVLLRWVDVES